MHTVFANEFILCASAHSIQFTGLSQRHILILNFMHLKQQILWVYNVQHNVLIIENYYIIKNFKII